MASSGFWRQIELEVSHVPPATHASLVRRVSVLHLGFEILPDHFRFSRSPTAIRPSTVLSAFGKISIFVSVYFWVVTGRSAALTRQGIPVLFEPRAASIFLGSWIVSVICAARLSQRYVDKTQLVPPRRKHEGHIVGGTNCHAV